MEKIEIVLRREQNNRNGIYLNQRILVYLRMVSLFAMYASSGSRSQKMYWSATR